MAIKFEPFNLGGGEIGTGIARGVLGATEKISERQNEERVKSFQREKILYDMQANIDPLTATFESNKKKYNELIKWYNEQRDDLIVKNKGINQDVLLNMSTLTNLVNNRVSQIKQEESKISEYYKKVYDPKNKGIYNVDQFEKDLANYIETGDMSKFLHVNPQDPFVYTGKQKKARF